MSPPTTANPTNARFSNPLSLAHVGWYAAGLGSLRIVLGFTFLWAFLDKLFGLGYTTKAANAWINGGSPTQGYLSSSFGPFGDAFQAIAGNPVTNVLFMGGLLGVGLALVLGMGVRIAAYSGAAMLALMYLSHPIFAASPNGTNPIVDDHIVYAIALLLLPNLKAGDYVGFGARWKESALVRRFPILA